MVQATSGDCFNLSCPGIKNSCSADYFYSLLSHRVCALSGQTSHLWYRSNSVGEPLTELNLVPCPQTKLIVQLHRLT